MENYPVDGVLVSSLVTQLYGAVGRDFDNTYGDLMETVQDPAASFQLTGSIMRASLLSGYIPTAWEEENLNGHQVSVAEHLREPWEREVDVPLDDTHRVDDISDDDDDLLERGQAIAAVAAYIDNTFTDAALESAELLEIIHGGTRYTVEKLENRTRVMNQTTGATLTFSDDFENDLLNIEDEDFTVQDYENLKALNERILHEQALYEKALYERDQLRKNKRQQHQITVERESNFEL